jgi:hypothetical protein
MPRYFFNIHHERQSVDTEGEQLPDDKAAWHEATIVAGELFRDMDGKFQPGQEWQLEVTDEQRKPLYAIRIHAEKK